MPILRFAQDDIDLRSLTAQQEITPAFSGFTLRIVQAVAAQLYRQSSPSTVTFRQQPLPLNVPLQEYI